MCGVRSEPAQHKRGISPFGSRDVAIWNQAKVELQTHGPRQPMAKELNSFRERNGAPGLPTDGDECFVNGKVSPILITNKDRHSAKRSHRHLSSIANTGGYFTVRLYWVPSSCLWFYRRARCFHSTLCVEGCVYTEPSPNRKPEFLVS